MRRDEERKGGEERELGKYGKGEVECEQTWKV